MYKLVISDDKGHTTVVPLLRDEVTIGRNEGNTIRLTERNVSRSHARLLKRNGAYVVEDLGSYNGVTVNGERIDMSSPLVAGDQLGIGDYDLAFQSDVVALVDTSPSEKPRSEPPPRLVVLSEPAAGAEFTLNKPTLRIGRDERLDIWINHKSISHEHAEAQLRDGKVTIYDLESANGMRVNGVRTSRAVLDAGDVLELGEVRFRFLPPEGAHSLDPLPEEALDRRTPSSSRKPLFVVSLLGIVVLVGVGAVFATMTGKTGAPTAAERPPAELPQSAATPETARAIARVEPGPDSDGPTVDEPREWEGQLARARQAMAAGRHDEAYAIANELPEDSVLRETPEFGEIRYRHAQSHLNAGERALEEGNAERARTEASFVLGLEGITPKQRRDGKRLLRRVREPGQGSPL